MRKVNAMRNSPALLAMMALFFCSNAFAHGDTERPLYVAEGGTDEGQCLSPANPCATIGFALAQAGKGGQIRVTEGAYAIEKAEDLFHLISGVVDVNGGYRTPGKSKFLATGDSVLTGVPYEYREQLRGRGFRIVADRKGMDDDKIANTDKLMQLHQQLKSSIPFTPCIGGSAAGLPCEQVDLLSHVGFEDISATPSAGADVWGFVDLNTGREYAIAGFNNGTGVFDVTDATNPREVGFIDGEDEIWRDIKVYQFFDSANDRWRAYAYVTTDGQTNDGLFVIDLSGLPHSVSRMSYTSDIASAHNVYATNTDYATGISITGDTPTLIVAGSNTGNGSYRSYSLANPASPTFVSGGMGSGYMHDASSMVITDPRKDTQCANAGTHCEVLLDFNENSFEIWDITVASNPVQLSNTPYLNAGYVHSGWWSEDKQFVFVHDELDERRSGLPTTLRVFSVANLGAPVLADTWSGPTNAIDHNGFVRGNRYYMSNYTRGLTILDITDPTNLVAVGRLDTYPVADSSMFNGAWGAYPFFHSGNIAISDIDSGFYMAADMTRDVPQGSLSFASASAAATEGQAAQLSVQRNGGTAGSVSVNYEIVHATAGSADYIVTSGLLNWANGENTNKTIDVTAVNDGINEGIERLLVRLISPGGSATLGNLSTASLYISDPGALAGVGFSEAAIETTESGFGTLIGVVQRSGSALGAVSVNYSMTAGNATAGTDFQGATSGTINWADGDADPKTLEFTVSDDGVAEIDEFFEISLNNSIGATIAGSASLNATIRNSGVGPAPTVPPPTTSSSGGGSVNWLFLLIGAGLYGRRFTRKGVA
ncbi:MAG: sodium:calcium exchanger [Gammaproteobacteria bacterium]|nr:MAG: sodium:calcium exchanger [Gammaproteobacteria bacterium]